MAFQLWLSNTNYENAGENKMGINHKILKWSSFFGIGLIILLASLIRLKGLGNQSFWLDEIGQIGIAAHSLPILLRDIRLHLSPPLDYIITHFMFQFGQSEFWLRLPSAVWGIGTVALTYALGRKIMNSAVGVFGAFLTAHSPALYLYSQELRMYSLFVFLSTAAFYLVLKLHDKRIWIWLLLINIAGLYTHYFFMFVLFTETILVLVVLPRGYKQWKKVFIGLLICGLIYLPWIPAIFEQNRHLQNGKLSYGMLPNLEYFKMMLSDFPAWGQKPLKNWYLYGLILGILSLGIKFRRKNTTILVLLLVPLGVTFLCSFFKRTVTPRNMIFILPVYYVLMAIAVYQAIETMLQLILKSIKKYQNSNYQIKHVKRWSQTIILIGTLFFSVVLIININQYHGSYRCLKPRWKILSQKLDALSKYNEIYVDISHTKVCLQYYYDPANFGTYNSPVITGSVLGKNITTPNKKEIIVVGNDMSWQDIFAHKDRSIIFSGKQKPQEKLYKKLVKQNWDDQTEEYWREMIRIYKVKK